MREPFESNCELDGSDRIKISYDPVYDDGIWIGVEEGNITSSVTLTFENAARMRDHLTLLIDDYLKVTKQG